MPVTAQRKFWRIRGNTHKRNILQVTPVGIARLEAGGAELLLQILDGELFAFGTGTAAFKFVRREHSDMLQQAITRKRLDRRIGSARAARASQSEKCHASGVAAPHG
jgi:hypothetical protein